MKIWQASIIFWYLSTAVSSENNCTQLEPGSFNCSGLSLTKVPQINVKGIVSLDLSHNDISHLSRTDFVNYKSLQRLDVSYNSITNISRDAFSPLVDLSILDLSCSFVADEAATNLASNPLNSLTSLNISGNFLRAIPSFSLPKVTDVSFAKNSISSANFDKSWTASKSLKSLSLANNRIESISSGEFSSLKNSISELDLSNCHLRNVDPLVLKHFSNSLEMINIENNYINDKIFLGMFSSANWKSLRDIRASMNNLTFQLFETFSKQPQLSFPNLASLRLANNNINLLNRDLALNKLLYLDLSKNQIQHIPSLAFTKCPTLEYLDLSGQRKPVYVYDNAFEALSNLKELYLSNDRISLNQAKLKIILSQTKSLTLLDLSGNQINQLFFDSFEVLHSLSTLNMSRCGLKRWDRLTFTNFANLSSLDLSFNSITSIKDPSQNTSLFSIYDTLDFIDLTGNPFICDCDILWLQHWLISNPHKARKYRSYTCFVNDDEMQIIKYKNESCGGSSPAPPTTTTQPTSTASPTTVTTTSPSTTSTTPATTTTGTTATTTSQQTTSKPTNLTTAIPTTSSPAASNEKGSFPIWATVLISLVSVVAVGSGVAFLLIRRRRRVLSDESNVPFLAFRDESINNSDNIPMIDFRRTIRRCFQSDPDYDLVL